MCRLVRKTLFAHLFTVHCERKYKEPLYFLVELLELIEIKITDNVAEGLLDLHI